MTKQGSFFPRANSWGMAQVWNMILGSKPERPAQERARIWASELGKEPIEVFLKMRGVEGTNPPNQRSKRKFVAGNFFERLVGYVLKVAGIYKDSQEWVSYTYPGLLEVSGKIDFFAGGIPDYDSWKEKLTEGERYLIQDFMDPIEGVINNFREKYPEGLGDLYLEVKSCSVFIMNAMEATGRSSKNHRLQLFLYLKAKNYPRGMIEYICRDDLRMYEVEVQNPSDVEIEFKAAIEEITRYYNAHKNTPVEKFLLKPDSSDVIKWEYNFANLPGLPPLAKEVTWDEDLGKFTRNWGIEYSNYLSMLYGYATPEEYREAVTPIANRWNRVMKRLKVAGARAAWLASHELQEDDVKSELVVVEGKKNRVRIQFVHPLLGDRMEIPVELQKGYEMKPEYLAVLEEIARAGYDANELVSKFADEKEDEEETV